MKIRFVSIGIFSYFLLQYGAYAQQCPTPTGEFCYRDNGECKCFPSPVTIVPMRIGKYIDLMVKSIKPEALPGIASVLKNNNSQLDALKWQDNELTGQINSLTEDQAKAVISDLGKSSIAIPPM